MQVDKSEPERELQEPEEVVTVGRQMLMSSRNGLMGFRPSSPTEAMGARSSKTNEDGVESATQSGKDLMTQEVWTEMDVGLGEHTDPVIPTKSETKE